MIGLATAWYCRQYGWEVTVLDRNRESRDGCSFGNAGMIVPSHFVPLAAPGMIRRGLKWMANPKSPFYIRPRWSLELVRWLWQFKQACTPERVRAAAPLLRDLHLQSRACYEELQDQLEGGFGLQKKGLLMLCRSVAALDEEIETAELAARLNVPAQVLDANETAVLDPNIEMDIHGAVYYPSDCHLSPNQLMEALRRQLADEGCQFVWEADTREFATSDGQIESVITTRGDFSADEFVLCGGVWSSKLAEPLGLSLPMQAGRGYSVTIDHPIQLPNLCSILTEARVAVTPIGTSLRFGGTMEIAGIEETIRPMRVQGIIDSVPRYFPKFCTDHFGEVQPWVGLRPCSPDGMPYLGRTGRWGNLLISTGHAMMGISLALVSGKVAAQLIEGQSPTIDRLELLSPDRYRR